MARVSLLGVVAICLTAGSALAADLPIADPVAYPAETVSDRWTGIYVGLHAGYGFGSGDVTRGAPLNAPTAFGWGAALAAGAIPGAINTDPAGFIGGLQIGYNYQMDSIVLGMEADFSFTGMNDATTVTSTFGVFNGVHRAEADLNWLATIRARAGFLAMENLLAYVTGGVAIGNVEHSWNTNFTSNIVPGARGFAGSNDETRVGWTVGGGLEYAATENISVKGEYLYFNLGDNDFSTIGTGVVPGFAGRFGASGDLDGHIFRVGVNYAF